MKKNKLLLAKIENFKRHLNKFKLGELSEDEFGELLFNEVSNLREITIEKYEIGVKKDEQQIEILKSIRYKLMNSLKLQSHEEKVVFSIIN
ncbi:hypothetical protein IMCC3317_20930 [Kordia antarctica]|uniref:Uncharacterized protein n=1 Tax=Kordia antarctica TaxID=1218801 RepID=A0A7L4ZJ38_9FLAO|nr:hypothetical protein [Kordia antarctica]QHI36723.1 hypothetical protein IMCC3317_20930 [Kordia antarctica]